MVYARDKIESKLEDGVFTLRLTFDRGESGPLTSPKRT
jgi:hypothetical protein